MANQEQIVDIKTGEPGKEQIVVTITFPPAFATFFQHVGKESETFQEWMRNYLGAIEGTIAGDLYDVMNGAHTHGLFDHLPREVCKDILMGLDDGKYGLVSQDTSCLYFNK